MVDRSCGQPLLMPRLMGKAGKRSRKWLYSKSRAPGYPPDSRANFGAAVGMAPTSAAGECAGASLAVRFAPRSPCSLTLVRKSRGTRSGVGRGRRRDDRYGGRARGPTKAPPTRATRIRRTMTCPQQQSPVSNRSGACLKFRDRNRSGCRAPGALRPLSRRNCSTAPYI